MVQQVRGDLSRDAWWSSGDSRLATPEGPEGPAGVHIAPCAVESVPLAVATCRLDKDRQSGPMGLCESSQHTVGAGLQEEL